MLTSVAVTNMVNSDTASTEVPPTCWLTTSLRKRSFTHKQVKELLTARHISHCSNSAFIIIYVAFNI